MDLHIFSVRPGGHYFSRGGGGAKMRERRKEGRERGDGSGEIFWGIQIFMDWG